MTNIDLPTLVGLLKEAREHVTEKPWDDTTLLHARISEALNMPVEYPEYVKQMRDEDYLG